MAAYHLVHGRALEDLSGRDAASIAWAFARLDDADEEALAALAQRVLEGQAPQPLGGARAEMGGGQV